MIMNKMIATGLKLSVFNLMIVALLGTLMRYKIAFSFPYLDQKFILLGHYNFAFYGWITSCIYIFILKYLYEKKPGLNTTIYKNLIAANFIVAYGMLISFLIGGYNWASIMFSILVLVISFVFCFYFIKDLKGVDGKAKIWFQSGFGFSMLSSVGSLYLSYMIMTKTARPDTYLAAQYFYLHYQYDGFFLFSCMGLLIYSFAKRDIHISKEQNRLIFWLMFFGCVIGYGLSVLWLKLPVWIFVLIIIGSVFQTIGAAKILLWIRKSWQLIKEVNTPFQRFILTYVGLAFVIKFGLQLGSTIPSISHFAFGFRNIVIAYLHLIFLMGVSTYLISRIIDTEYFKETKIYKWGVILFLLSVFLNELMLGVIGAFSINYTFIPHSPEILFGITLLILISALTMFFSMKRQK